MIHSTVFYMVFVLRDFIITNLLSFQTCLILKSSLLLLKFILGLFCFFVFLILSLLSLQCIFCPCFCRRRREISTCATCYLSFIINKVQIHHAIRLVEKHVYVESTSLNAVFTIFDLDLTLVCTFRIILASSI